MTNQNSVVLAEIVGKRVEDESGVRLGRVNELRIKNSEVEAIICGPAGLLQRFASFRTGTRVPWDDVIGCGQVIVVRRSSRR